MWPIVYTYIANTEALREEKPRKAVPGKISGGGGGGGDDWGERRHHWRHTRSHVAQALQ